MKHLNTGLETYLETLVSNLIDEYSEPYVLFALKKISDRQLLFVSFDGYSFPDDPVLKMLELVNQDLEAALFDSEWRILDKDDLKSVVQWLLDRFFKKDGHNGGND